MLFTAICMKFLCSKEFDDGLIDYDNIESVMWCEECLGPKLKRIEEGIQKSGLKRAVWSSGSESKGKGYFIEADRQKAIKNAISMADEKDLVLIAGKGHEDYQIIGGEIRCFDDRKEAALAAS